jgi:hypothetical protein
LILRKEPDEPEPEPAQGPEQDAVPQRDGP